MIKKSGCQENNFQETTTAIFTRRLKSSNCFYELKFQWLMYSYGDISCFNEILLLMIKHIWVLSAIYIRQSNYSYIIRYLMVNKKFSELIEDDNFTCNRAETTLNNFRHSNCCISLIYCQTAEKFIHVSSDGYVQLQILYCWGLSRIYLFVNMKLLGKYLRP